MTVLFYNTKKIPYILIKSCISIIFLYNIITDKMEQINIDIINFDAQKKDQELSDLEQERDLEDGEEQEDKQMVFIWEELSPEWQSKLFCKAFVIKNCLGDGNCQFRSIETALTNSGCKTDHEKLRKSISKYINSLDNKDFFDIIQHYRIEAQAGEFVGDWDPFNIKNKRQFITELKKPGFNFQGDNITLSLVSKAMNIDILLLDNKFNITNLSNPEQLQPKIIILYYDQSAGHYQTIGLRTKRKKVNTLFKRIDLPDEIDKLLDKHTFLLEHIKHIIIQCKRIQLNQIIKQLEDRIKTKISKDDKIKIMKIIKMILENENYFEKIKK